MILSSTEPDNGGLYISNSSHTSISQPRDFNLSLNTAGSELAELEAVEPGALLSLGLISFPRLGLSYLISTRFNVMFAELGWSGCLVI